MPSLKDLLGTAYKDGMTVDEMDAVLTPKNLVDPSTQHVVPKDTFDKTSSELADLKKKLKTLETTTLTSEEKMAQALKDAQDTKSQYMKELSKVRATEVLIKAGLTEKDYSSFLDGIVSEDAVVSTTLATALAGMVTSQREAAEQKVRNELMSGTPKPQQGNPNSVQFDAQLKAARESGDMAAMAAILRQQQTPMTKI